MISHVAKEAVVAPGLGGFGTLENLELVEDVVDGVDVGLVVGGIEELGLEGIDFAAEESAGDEGFDFGEVRMIGEQEFVDMIAEFCFVVGVGAEIEGIGVEPVAEVVLRRAGFARGGGGAFGFGAVAAGGLALGVGGPASGLAGFRVGHFCCLEMEIGLDHARARPGIKVAEGFGLIWGG